MSDSVQRDEFPATLRRLGDSAGDGVLRAELGRDEGGGDSVGQALADGGASVSGRSRRMPEAVTGEEGAVRAAAAPTAATAATALTAGYEAELWRKVDALRGIMDPAEYKHVVLGLIFLKYISDAFAQRHAEIEAEPAQGVDPESPDADRALNVLLVPPEACWPHLMAQARRSAIGQRVDAAMAALERDNPALEGVLPWDYARPALDKTRLGQLIEVISTFLPGDAEARARGLPGHIYDSLLDRFAGAEGKGGGSFYTPRCVVALLVEMLGPLPGRIYDPCCGSSGMLVRAMDVIRARASDAGNAGTSAADITIFGQESNDATWRLAKMNLAIHGVDARIARGDTFHSDHHPDLLADVILAGPPFNDSDWGGERLKGDPRWAYGVPPAGNANFAWVQHIVHHLAPTGIAGLVLANASMSSIPSGECEIRKNLIEADLVDCIVALPGQLFHSTPIPACLWLLARDRKDHKFRDRRGEVLFIDARRLGVMVDRARRDLSDAEIAQIAGVYHLWRGEKAVPSGAVGDRTAYEDMPAFCKSASLEDIRAQGYVLTPGRYVDAEPARGEDDPFVQMMAPLVAALRGQQEEGARLDAAIQANLTHLGFSKGACDGE